MRRAQAPQPDPALLRGIRQYHDRPFVERVTVSEDTYLAGLELIGDAWNARCFPQLRSALSYSAGVELERHRDEPGSWYTGLLAWREGRLL